MTTDLSSQLPDDALERAPERGDVRPQRADAAHRRSRLSTKALSAGVASLGASLGAGAAIAPAAQASCWTSTCRAYVNNSRFERYAREYGPWAYSPNYIYSNHAHFYDCVQMYVSNGAGGTHYLPDHCGASPYYPSLPTVSHASQGLAWRMDLPQCSAIWAREQGAGLRNSRHLYSPC